VGYGFVGTFIHGYIIVWLIGRGLVETTYHKKKIYIPAELGRRSA